MLIVRNPNLSKKNTKPELCISVFRARNEIQFFFAVTDDEKYETNLEAHRNSRCLSEKDFEREKCALERKLNPYVIEDQ